jgi:hypothetical protein
MSIDDIIELVNNKTEFEGNLVLVIICNDCNSQFELNPESIAMCLAVDGTIWDYIKYVQNSKCRVCKKEEK